MIVKSKKIDFIVQQTCEILKGCCSFYIRVDNGGKSLVTASKYQAPPDFQPGDACQGNLFYDVIMKKKKEPIVIEDLQETIYKESSPVIKYGLQSYLGVPVFLKKKIIGSLCLMDIKKRKFTSMERNIVSTFAKVLSFEEERIVSEGVLVETRDWLYSVFEGSLDAIFISDTDAMFTYVNEAAEKLTGYSRQELLTMSIPGLHDPEDLGAFETFFQRILAGEDITTEALIRRKDGSKLAAEFSNKRVVVGGLLYMHTTARDITARKKAETALQESEKQYRLLVENANDAIYILQDDLIKFHNPKAEEMLGYSGDELASLSFINIIHPSDRDMVSDTQASILKGDPLPNVYSFKLINKTGEELWGQLNSVLITWAGKPATLNFLRDITPQRKMENQFHQAQRMEAIGTLAGGIAHDFNNLLMGIEGRASLMMIDTEESHPHFEHLTGIQEYVKNAASLCSQLLGFARGGKYEVIPTDLNKLIKEQNQMFGRTKKEIHILEKFEKNLWVVEVDQGQIKQVLLNLYVNAWQAMPGEENLYVQTDNITITETYGKPYHVEPGRYVKISVTDTGVGMDEEIQQRIFDPFFTTKEKGRGTGLGLASVYGIVKSHKGFINVYSEIGEGTTFNIYLPASDAQLITEKKPPQELLRGSETLLLVDDEEMIISVGSRMLKRLGYQVITAQGGIPSIKTYREHEHEIDLVILDMIMPDLSGAETFEVLKKINPGVKVLLSSGYSINGQAAEILERGCKGFIQKPFNMKTLSQKLRKILDNK
jgi:two-component system cell cycle sensor histidine kinase/response regulator CckA